MLLLHSDLAEDSRVLGSGACTVCTVEHFLNFPCREKCEFALVIDYTGLAQLLLVLAFRVCKVTAACKAHFTAAGTHTPM